MPNSNPEVVSINQHIQVMAFFFLVVDQCSAILSNSGAVLGAVGLFLGSMNEGSCQGRSTAQVFTCFVP